MKVTLIKNHDGLGRKKGDKLDCTEAEAKSLIDRGYVADPAKKKSTADGASG